MARSPLLVFALIIAAASAFVQPANYAGVLNRISFEMPNCGPRAPWLQIGDVGCVVKFKVTAIIPGIFKEWADEDVTH